MHFLKNQNKKCTINPHSIISVLVTTVFSYGRDNYVPVLNVIKLDKTSIQENILNQICIE